MKKQFVFGYRQMKQWHRSLRRNTCTAFFYGNYWLHIHNAILEVNSTDL